MLSFSSPDVLKFLGHGLIQKVPKTYRYQVTSHGRLAITAVLTVDRTSVALLNRAAAWKFVAAREEHDG